MRKEGEVILRDTETQKQNNIDALIWGRKQAGPYDRVESAI